MGDGWYREGEDGRRSVISGCMVGGGGVRGSNGGAQGGCIGNLVMLRSPGACVMVILFGV